MFERFSPKCSYRTFICDFLSGSSEIQLLSKKEPNQKRRHRDANLCLRHFHQSAVTALLFVIFWAEVLKYNFWAKKNRIKNADTEMRTYVWDIFTKVQLPHFYLWFFERKFWNITFEQKRTESKRGNFEQYFFV